MDLPVVDFKACSLDYSDEELTESNLKTVGEELCKVFHEVGFVYLKNFGISTQQIEEVFSLTEKFSALPIDVKRRYQRPVDRPYGWLPMEQEKANPTRPHDWKESFNYMPVCHQAYPTMDTDIPGYSASMQKMYNMCAQLTKRVLDSLGYGLHLKDPGYFNRAHNYSKDNNTCLRVLNYPAIEDPGLLKPGQLRCGEHSDWGTITLLFQDNAGGLQVCSNEGFVDATPIPGTVVVNIGDLMQRWSSDYFVSRVHRVVVPTGTNLQQARRSMAFFANPDNDCQIISLERERGTTKYKDPVLTRDFINMKIQETRILA